MLTTLFDRLRQVANHRLFDSRFWALTIKEINQILRNKQLIFLLIFPPTVQLLIYGAALNPEVQFLKLGVVDYAKSQTSRELVAAMTENQIFVPELYLFSERELGEAVRQGNVTTGLVIPPEFDRRLVNGETAEVQVLIDGVDANTAGIARGYISQIIAQFSRRVSPVPVVNPIEPEVTFLYNPGLLSSWFFVPGVLGVVLTLTSSLVSSATVVREKDTGTLEQLLMTPSAAWEILLAKIVPLFVLLMGDVLLALGVGRLVFNLPFRGNFPMFMLISALYVSIGIGIGIFLATISKNQRQVVLTSFFINLPLIQTSGAIAPIESMPAFFRYLSLVNPLRHYVAISRGFLLKGIGVAELWHHILALGVFAVLLLILSTRQFRRQLG
ncbi:ABC transporter permease [Egbenema bharatensis]|uniref:ABC transporter permease n=1 Tax=Egbenema bharatensis TaxID=3463334 RepID=UPI003A89ABBF